MPVVLKASAVIVLGVLALGASRCWPSKRLTQQTSPAAPASPSSSAALTETTAPLEEITVTSARLNLIGSATTASEGVVDASELALTPAYRSGQLLETVPGLVVTVHSGEGKANQYLMRGFNLDHGTDLATFIDAVPVNEPSHAHGQGYTDLNFLIPELAGGLSTPRVRTTQPKATLRESAQCISPTSTRFPMGCR